MIPWVRVNWTYLDLACLLLFLGLFLFTEYRPEWLRSRSKPKVSGARRLCTRDIPGPRPSLPLLGTRWVFSALGPYTLSKLHEAYRDMFQRYGKIVREEALWNYPVISLVERAAIEQVLKHPSRYPLRPPTEVTVHYRLSRPDRYSNLGLVNEQGETWHNLRSTLTPELTSVKTVNRFLPEQNAVTDDFVALLRTSRDSDHRVSGFEELANRMGLEVTCSLMLGRRMGFLSDAVDPVTARLAKAVKTHFCSSRDTYYGLPFWKAFPSKAYRQFVESEEVIYEIISELVETSLQEEMETCQTSDVQSVFISILQAHGLDVREKKAAIIDFIAAGIQTLGNTLVFLLYLISKHPRVQQRLHEELTDLAARGVFPDADSLKKANYLRACILEAFRVLPTAPCVARILETDTVLSGYHVAAGTAVLCHTWMACLDESNFKDATQFRPERWLGEGPRQASFLVVPFGCGRRMCPGKRFIEQELSVVLARVVWEFQLDFDGELGLQFEFLLAPEGPVTLTLTDRH